MQDYRLPNPDPPALQPDAEGCAMAVLTWLAIAAVLTFCAAVL